MVHHRAGNAPTEALPPFHNEDADRRGTSPSEQAVLVLTLIDSLSVLSLESLQEWLPLTAAAANAIEQQDMRQQCRQRFWEALSKGEMDVGRAAICVSWWNTGGGRNMLLFGGSERDDGPFMSGALGETSRL